MRRRKTSSRRKFSFDEKLFGVDLQTVRLRRARKGQGDPSSTFVRLGRHRADRSAIPSETRSDVLPAEKRTIRKVGRRKNSTPKTFFLRLFQNERKPTRSIDPEEDASEGTARTISTAVHERTVEKTASIAERRRLGESEIRRTFVSAEDERLLRSEFPAHSLEIRAVDGGEETHAFADALPTVSSLHEFDSVEERSNCSRNAERRRTATRRNATNQRQTDSVAFGAARQRLAQLGEIRIDSDENDRIAAAERIARQAETSRRLAQSSVDGESPAFAIGPRTSCSRRTSSTDAVQREGNSSQSQTRRKSSFDRRFAFFLFIDRIRLETNASQRTEGERREVRQRPGRYERPSATAASDGRNHRETSGDEQIGEEIQEGFRDRPSVRRRADATADENVTFANTFRLG